MMMNVPSIIGKRDIKREFKTAGYGSINKILFEPETFNGYNTVYIWFRPTTNEEVLEKRNELQWNVENDCSQYNYIDICCEKTPRLGNGTFDRWFLIPNTERETPSVSVKKDSDQVTYLMARIAELEERLECNVNTTYQLLGGLFHQTNQRHVLDNCVGYLLRGKHSLVPSGESIWPTTRQGDELEKKVEDLEAKLEQMSLQKDTYERKLAALENRLDHCEFQLPSYPQANNVYDCKLAALEKKFEGLYREMSHTTSLTNNIDSRLRAVAQCLTREL